MSDASLSPVSPRPLTLSVPQVTVIGYPIGGDTMSVTSGVVSRIEVTSYVHGSSELLGVQIDAAINAGNSGAERERCHCCCNRARGGCTEGFTSPACSVRLQRPCIDAHVVQCRSAARHQRLSCARAGGPAFTNRGECCGIAFQSLRVRPVAHAAHVCTDLHINQIQEQVAIAVVFCRLPPRGLHAVSQNAELLSCT